MSQGTIKWFNDIKGYGFISRENGDDLFVHKNDINGYVNDGDPVEFNVGAGRKGECAVMVRKI